MNALGRPAALAATAAGGLLLVAIGLSLGCRGERPERRYRNLILVSIDTLRADHLGAYGYERETSPFLDELALRGVRFANAFAQTSWTLPSHMSLMTSRQPAAHGVEIATRALPEDLATLPEALHDAGWDTDGFVSWIYLQGRYGFSRGFDRYRELLPPADEWDSATHESIKAGDVVDRVLAALEREPPSPPYFLFLHLFDPHLSYEPPLDDARLFAPALASTELGSYEHLDRYVRDLRPSFDCIPEDELRAATALYDGEIHHVDRELRRLFAALDERRLLDDALIAVTSDHGEELADHGSMEGHQWTLYDEVLRVPLLLVFPDRRHAGLVIDRVVQSVDVAPTLLALLGVAPPPTFQGRSLLPLLADPADPAWEDVAYARVRRFNATLAVRTATHKLIYRQSLGDGPPRFHYELYDLAADPGEQRDVFSPDDPVARDLLTRLRRYRESEERAAPPAPEASDEERRRLESVGYAG